MNGSRSARTIARRMAAAGILMLCFTALLAAQVQTQQAVQQGAPTQTTIVESGVIEYVMGNDLFIRMDNGELRHFPNVPETATAMVDGRPVTIRDAKPGMRLQRTTITTTAPQTVTTTRTVNGTVWEVQAPNWVILTMDNNTNRRFNIPKGQKFMNEGRVVDAFGLRKGMKISVTAVSVTPGTTMSQQARTVGSTPPPPIPMSANLPLVIEDPTPVPAPTLTASAQAPAQIPQELPRTGSLVPLVGLLGLLSFAASFGIRALRRS